MSDMSERYGKAVENLTQEVEQVCRETTEALDRATKAQAEVACKVTEMMTRGYRGVVNGTVGAMVHACVGFLDGFSRAWQRTPDKSETN